MEIAEICIVLVYGIPGSGKSTFCGTFLRQIGAARKVQIAENERHYQMVSLTSEKESIELQKLYDYFISELENSDSKAKLEDVHSNVLRLLVNPPQLTVHLVSLDVVQKEITELLSNDNKLQATSKLDFCFDPFAWRLSRQLVFENVEKCILGHKALNKQETDSSRSFSHEDLTKEATVCGKIATNSCRYLILVDDTFHFSSMRKRYFALAKHYGCSFHQIFLDTPLEECLHRNSQRLHGDRIPDSVISGHDTILRKGLKLASTSNVRRDVCHNDSIRSRFSNFFLHDTLKKWENQLRCHSWQLNGMLDVNTQVHSTCVGTLLNFLLELLQIFLLNCPFHM
ncbi:hypothetical protein IE077_001900 [Cardiosporidium cionae]|uniref:L-seryl-tRNA(Sec) kinase n=1 Tax=Cardiosporidium cionae TaxID=476202 RepID=A0ABQ7JG24_9APIC|nr:hypothetical protein IE077_001900 [Cardiosporidium cionae]|eukprot:KAF8822943.1 hypothetical protein IE077_001900 [Cardiosporidium cionae]